MALDNLHNRRNLQIMPFKKLVLFIVRGRGLG
jgi:hypothetical protein